jgi:hypothetical protein
MVNPLNTGDVIPVNQYSTFRRRRVSGKRRVSMKFVDFRTTKGVHAFVVPEQVAAIVDIPPAGGMGLKSSGSTHKCTIILVCGLEIEVQGSAQESMKKLATKD